MMSRSINSDKSWNSNSNSNSTDDELDECDNSSTSNSNSTSRRVSSSADDINGQLITTHSMSAVIRPGSKMPRNDPLQFVKIQNNDLSKKAVEQIKLAEEVKITKEKIKEVEEEWQNNLLNWKSKRRISKSNSDDQSGTSATSQRKTKTFSEILSEKAKSGHRIGYNLHKYLDGDIDNENELLFEFDNNYESNTDNDRNSDESYKSDTYDDTTIGNNISKNSGLGDVIVFDTSLLEEFNCNRNHDQRQESSEDDDSISGEVINNSSQSSKNICRDNHSNNDLLKLPNSKINEYENNTKNKLLVIESYNVNNKNQDTLQLNVTREEKNHYSENSMAANVAHNKPEKVKVEIKDWKMQNQRENVLQYLLQQEQNTNHHQRVRHQSDLNSEEYISADSHYNSYDAEEDDYDEEMERLRLEQEKSFREKLSAFEMLAKQENENIYVSVKPNNDNKIKTKEEVFKRQPPAVEELLESEQLQQLMSPRQLYSGQYLDDNDDDSEDAINARIQQLQIERQRAQTRQTQQSFIQNQQRTGHVIYQSNDYPESPPQQTQHKRQPEQQQYYLVDEPIVKQNQIPVKQTQLPCSPPKITPNQSIQSPPHEHLYVNQKQLFINQMHPQFYDQIESRERFRSPSPLYKEYNENNVIYDSQKQVPPLQQTVPVLPPQAPQDSNSTQAQHQQYLYYPKPYISNKSAPVQQQQLPSIQKSVMALPQPKQQTLQPPQQTRPQQQLQQPQPPPQPSQQLNSSSKPQSKPQPPASKPKPQQKGYNQNHWLLQEAELRRHLATIPSATTKQQSHQAVPTQRQTLSNSSNQKTPPLAPPKGMLSVSGKKKCSSCGDELGRGCAAMVVESLSLYYHISCFRCSVCNIQLGNGTVGTDVRVRNHKLHCQNCYSNDEAGLKFSRV